MSNNQYRPRGAYHRPGYLRALGAYQGVKKGYEYCRGFVGVRTVAPIVEWVAEGTLARVPVIKNMKDDDSADGYPMLHGIDSRLLEMLREFDDYLDITVANPKTLQGRALRNLTHSVYTVAGYTPVVGPRIRTIMIDLHPDHMARAPRLMDRPAIDTTGDDDVDGDMRGSFDKDMDDVSVMTDENEMEEEVNEKASKKSKKDKGGRRKDKRFLQNMGKGIKKVMNYPKTPVHEDMPAHLSAVSVTSGRDSPNQSIATEDVAALASSSISSAAAAKAASTSSMGSATASRKFFGSSKKNLREGEVLPPPPHA